MKQFNLEEALNGKPVKLRDGSKAIVLTRIPDIYKLENGLKVTFPLLGIILDTKGAVDDQYACWKDNGMFTPCTSDYDIVGMWEEPKLTTEELMEMAFNERLVLKHPLLLEGCKGFKVVGKTVSGSYILQDCDNYKMYFLHTFNENLEWSVKE